MKKNILLALAFSVSCLFAQESIQSNNSVPVDNFATQGLDNELDIITSVVPKDGNLLKAHLYEYGYPKENIKPDPAKALEFYKKAYDEKNPIAAYKLGVVAWQLETKENSFRGAPLQFFLNGGKFQPEEQAILNLIAGAIYLYQQGNYKEAIDVLQKPLKKRHATAELYAALSYFVLGNEGKANSYLTAACTNKSQNTDIRTFCQSNSAVEQVDLRKGASIAKDYPSTSCGM